VATLVSEIAGPEVEVFSILGPADSPATYQVSDADVTRISRSQLYFRVGVPFESSPGLAALPSMPNLRTVDLRAGIEERSLVSAHGHGEGHGHGPHRDPHIWLSPRALATMAETIRDGLCEAAPERCEEIKEAHGRVAADLEALDVELTALFSCCAGAEFYVFHPSWGYLAEDYGLIQVGVESEGKMPSDAELAKLARGLRLRGVTVLFTEPQLGGSSAEAAARALGVELEVLDPLAPDLLDNLRYVSRRLAEVASAGSDERGIDP